MQAFRIPTLIALLLLNCSMVYAEPWFTGPLLAPSGKTIPRKGITVFLETGHASSDSIYNREWQRIAEPSYKMTQINPQFMYGLTDRIDIQYNAFYQMNQSGVTAYEHIGDSSVLLGFQALSQDTHPSHPDLRITIEELLPSGLFDLFSAANAGTEATGLGSYQTTLGLNFQYLSELNVQHYLKSHLSMSYTYAVATNINGLSTYGGTSRTRGRIHPGNAVSIDLAGELTLTQQWVAVMEASFIYQQASRFKGVLDLQRLSETISRPDARSRSKSRRLLPNTHNIGGPGVGSGNLDQITLAPALEYNFSKKYGVLAGMWFTVAGKNTPNFASSFFQLSASW